MNRMFSGVMAFLFLILDVMHQFSERHILGKLVWNVVIIHFRVWRVAVLLCSVIRIRRISTGLILVRMAVLLWSAVGVIRIRCVSVWITLIRISA